MQFELLENGSKEKTHSNSCWKLCIKPEKLCGTGIRNTVCRLWSTLADTAQVIRDWVSSRAMITWRRAGADRCLSRVLVSLKTLPTNSRSLTYHAAVPTAGAPFYRPGRCKWGRNAALTQQPPYRPGISASRGSHLDSRTGIVLQSSHVGQDGDSDSTMSSEHVVFDCSTSRPKFW